MSSSLFEDKSRLDHENQLKTRNKILTLQWPPKFVVKINLLFIISIKAFVAGESGTVVKNDFPSSQHLPKLKRESNCC
jgi:hypothetical protein